LTRRASKKISGKTASKGRACQDATSSNELEVPRDRPARFDPQLIAKYQRRFPGLDDKIISMSYARGMSTREIVHHLRDLYGIDVSPDLISAITDAVPSRR